MKKKSSKRKGRKDEKENVFLCGAIVGEDLDEHARRMVVKRCGTGRGQRRGPRRSMDCRHCPPERKCLTFSPVGPSFG